MHSKHSAGSGSPAGSIYVEGSAGRYILGGILMVPGLFLFRGGRTSSLSGGEFSLPRLNLLVPSAAPVRPVDPHSVLLNWVFKTAVFPGMCVGGTSSVDGFCIVTLNVKLKISLVTTCGPTR